MATEIIAFSRQYVQDVLQISNEQVGKDFIDKNYLDFFLNAPRAKGMVAVVNKKVAGFTFFQWCLPEEISDYIFADKQWLGSIFRNVPLIGYRNLTAVKKEFQGRGIGRMLVESSIGELKKRSGVLANVVWRAHRKKNLKNALEKHGLVRIRTIDNYWKEDSLRRKYECAVCGQPPCRCTADIYISESVLK